MEKTHWITVRKLKENEVTQVGNSISWRAILTNGELKIFHLGNGTETKRKVDSSDVIGVKPDGAGGVEIFHRKPPKDPRAALLWEYGFHRAHRVDFPASKEQAVAYASKNFNAYDAKLLQMKHDFLQRLSIEEVIDRCGFFDYSIVFHDHIFLMVVKNDLSTWKKWAMKPDATMDEMKKAISELTGRVYDDV